MEVYTKLDYRPLPLNTPIPLNLLHHNSLSKQLRNIDGINGGCAGFVKHARHCLKDAIHRS